MHSRTIVGRVFRKLHWWGYRFYWQHVYGNIVHPIKERRHRAPDLAYRESLNKTTSPEMMPVLEALDRDGIVVLPKWLEGEQLRQVQQDFSDMCDFIAQASPSPQFHFEPSMFGLYPGYIQCDPNTNSTYAYHPYHYSRLLLNLALDPFITGLVERYFGKPVMHSETIASRYYPMPPKDFLSWRWHSDGLGKRINVMFLFTDVGPADQYMDYVKGTHRLIHRYPHHGGSSRFSEDDVRRYSQYEHLQCVGPAGTVFVFDSNGIHRGNRSMGAVRDTLIASYCCGSETTGFPIRRASYDALTAAQREFLHRNPRVELVD
jgi:hypothetical protein